MAGLPEIKLDFGESFGNALAQTSHARYLNEHANALVADEARKQDAQQYIQPAMQGDNQAMGRLAYGDPRAAVAVTTALQRMDANQRANVKAAADFTAQASNAILQADPSERPALYQRLYAQGQRNGYDMSGLPPTYSPAVDGELRSRRAMAVPITEWFKQNEGVPTPIGGGGIGGGGASVPAMTRDQFIQTMAPHALEVAKATGLDPRLVLAQSALETGFGANAPGNNYFGVKAGANTPNAQTLPTTEVGPNGPYQTQASFRSYADPGESARDYATFLQTNSRYAPVLGAQGLDAQIEAMGRSGYATDPNYAAKLRQIAQSLPPMEGGVPAAAPAANGPPVQVAGPPQAVTAPNAAPAAPAGAPSAPPAAPPVQGLTAGVKLPPGAQMMGIKGVPVVKDGNVLIRTQDGAMDWVPIPQRPPAAVFEDVKDANGNLIGQRNKATNQYHAVTQVPGASGIDPNLKGDDVYAALPPARAAEIRSIVEGDNPIPPPTSRAPYAQETRNLVFQAAGPGFTDATHAQRMAMKKDMNTGKIGQALQAQGTLFNHMDHALDIADNLNNSPYPVVNKALNAVGLAQGDPRVVELEATKTRINQELEKYFAGHTTVSGLAEARNELNAAQSPEQIKAAIRTLATLVNGQQSELVHRINRGLGYTGDKQLGLEDPLIISPEGAKARDDVLSRTQPNPGANSKLMDEGKQFFGAKKPGEPANVPKPGNYRWTPQGMVPQ